MNVGGVLISNTIWTMANSPYYVVADVQVPYNSTLTIQAGVTVLFNGSGDFEILIKGILLVQGMINKRVTFSGIASNDTKWMITFKATNLSLSSIVYADFMGPKQAVQLDEVNSGVPINTGELTLQFCKFTGTQINTNAKIFYPGSFLVPPTLAVRNSTIIDSLVSNGLSYSEVIHLIGTNLQNTTINVGGRVNKIQLTECRGGNLSVYISVSDGYFEMNDSILTNVLITYRQFPGAYFFATQDFLVIRQSTLHNATISMSLTGYGSLGHVDIIASTLTVPQPIQIDLGSIQCSSISSFCSNSNLTGIQAGSLTIVNSSIFDFAIGLYIYQYTQPMGNITNSNFYKNSLYNIMNLADSNVNATGNWWGTTKNIENTLFDYWKNINYGQVFFTQYTQSRIVQQC